MMRAPLAPAAWILLSSLALACSEGGDDAGPKGGSAGSGGSGGAAAGASGGGGSGGVSGSSAGGSAGSAAGAGTAGAPGCDGPPLALLAWPAQMTSYGEKHCALLGDSTQSFDSLLGATYYDSERVFYQIADHTGEQAKWSSCAQAAEAIYRDGYVITNDGKVPGYWNFTRGLAEDFLRTGDDASRQAVVLLAENAAYCADPTPLDWTSDEALSREVAYCMLAYIEAERVGQPRRTRLKDFVEQALGHIDQWFVKKSSPNWAPFMFALTAEALIEYHDRIEPDARILPAIELGLEAIWTEAWLPAERAFWYRMDDQSSAVDLNLLLAPVFGWAYAKTCKQVHRERGDQVFAGGVENAYLDGPKQYNQSYRWSFDYVRWRR
jgi:hypothetical protein